MRTVSFVEFAELEYDGNVFSKAITAADVDNDNYNELVIGNVHGNLYIYKGIAESKPWAKASDLGMITCVEVGDVCNQGMKQLVTLSAEGWCNIFLVRPDLAQTASEMISIYDGISMAEPAAATDSSSDNAVPEGSSEERQQTTTTAPFCLKPGFKQRLPGNSKVFVIADIDGDGQNELIIGYTDRVVRSYKWMPDLMPTSLPSSCPPSSSSWSCGSLVLSDKWLLAGQIGSVSANNHSDGRLTVMVSQPGGTLVTLICSNSKVGEQSSNGRSSQSVVGAPSVSYQPLGSVRARNPGVTTEIVSSISRQRRDKDNPTPNYSAICTLDELIKGMDGCFPTASSGTLTLVDDDKILWSLYVDHQLFSLSKLDVTGDGTEEVIACSWDGQTYIVNLQKEVVRFHFRENVAAFCAGLYAVDKDRNVPCLFYATFNNKIVVYYNIRMSSVGISDLVSTIAARKEDIDHNLLRSFNCDSTKPVELKQLYRWLLYENS